MGVHEKFWDFWVNLPIKSVSKVFLGVHNGVVIIIIIIIVIVIVIIISSLKMNIVSIFIKIRTFS